MNTNKYDSDMSIYIQCVAVCKDCEYKVSFLYDKDKEIWHECNQGNKSFRIPKVLKLDII